MVCNLKKTLIFIFSVLLVAVLGYVLLKYYNLSAEEDKLSLLEQYVGSDFPGSDYHPPDRTNWMLDLNPDKLRINQIVWPGTHDSATNGIGIKHLNRPFSQCQTLSIYEQLKIGARVLDIRVQEDRRVCHGMIASYNIARVIDDVKRFLEETRSEIIILEVRTESGYKDPPEFDKYVVEQLGDYLIVQDIDVFTKTISELLPSRVIFVWKPHDTDVGTDIGRKVWSPLSLMDNWTDTDLPYKKFKNNLMYLADQPKADERDYFYRVENTLTEYYDDCLMTMSIKTLSGWIRSYTKMFIALCFAKGIENKLQILSTDFIDEDFVDACVGLTSARVEESKV